MLAPEGWPVGPFPQPLSPRTVQLMPQPCIVSNRHKPLSTDLRYFPPDLEVAITWSPYWLGREGKTWGVWQRTSATLIAGNVPDRCMCCQYLSHPSAGIVTARSQSFRHHNSVDNCASMPSGVCPGVLCIPLSLQPPPQHFLLFGRSVSMASVFLAISLGGCHKDDRSHPGWGWLLKLGWCPCRTAYLQTPEIFSGQAA